MKDVSSEVVCFGAQKDAALYFDRVFPFDGAAAVFDQDIWENHIPLDDISSTVKILNSLFGDENKLAVIAYIRQIPAIALGRLFKTAQKDSELKRKIRSDEEFLRQYRELAKIIGFDFESALRSLDTPEILDQKLNGMSETLVDSVRNAGFSLKTLWDATGIPDDNPGEENLFVSTLRDIRLVDVNKASWDQIIEFRKDKKSQFALKRFRAFFSENYDGKDKQFIIDDLLSRLDEQEETAKRWGFEIARRSLGAAFTDRSFLVTTLGSVLAGAGVASLPVLAAAGGSVILGGCAIEFSKVRAEKRAASVAAPLTYLTDIRKKLDPEA